MRGRGRLLLLLLAALLAVSTACVCVEVSVQTPSTCAQARAPETLDDAPTPNRLPSLTRLPSSLHP
jgi:hypothetical protein